MNFNLLTYEDNVGMPSPEVSRISAFKNIIDRDPSENKHRAANELAYVYFMEDWQSPYAPHPEEERSERIIRDLFEDVEWEPDEAITEARKVYAELRKNDYILMLEASREAAQKLREYFRDVDLTATDKKGKLVHKSTDLMRNLKDVADVMESLEKQIELIKKNEKEDEGIRGGFKLNKYTR